MVDLIYALFIAGTLYGVIVAALWWFGYYTLDNQGFLPPRRTPRDEP